MESITITIKTGNAAFEDYPNELGRILRELATRIDDDYFPAILSDNNGQAVGAVVVK